MKWFVTAANRLNHVDIYKWQAKGSGFEPVLVKRIPTGKTPSHLAINSASTIVYASLQDSEELMAIDLLTQKPLWVVPVGKTPADIFLTSDDKNILVALTGGTGVQVYDVSNGPAKLVKTIQTGDGAHAFRSQGDKRHLFVSNRAANTISRIDLQTMTVVDTYKTPAGPDCMEVLEGGKTLLVTARWAGKLVVIDLEKKAVVKAVAVGKSPHGVWTLNHASRS
jgi:DNA-binding beta-propeller fold protein YncE